MLWAQISALALLAREAAAANAVLRFGCSQITIERLDPLVNPAQAPSPHVHQVVGGNAFNASIPQADVSTLADCTSCSFSEDLSNYWTANMYFRAKNGTFKRVPQIPNRYLTGASGGITVYYTSPYDGSKATAFKPGFRMLAGDPTLRSTQGFAGGICNRCYNAPNFGGDNLAPCSDSSVDTVTLPTKPCPGGIRSTVKFPTCWDGKNLDSADHRSHVAYPSSGTFENSGPCPSTHPVKLPQLMFEVVWDTTAFNDQSNWPADGHPFVLSMGDQTGYGQHADYVFGWKGSALQDALDAGCFGASCSALKTQAFTDANKCAVKTTIQENVDGWLISLPGNNPIS